jgi:glycine/D-amino acid oxidase-like deaminating enzyme/nitrite reductase/ring-hydroxylating ferredoxin subunit
MSPWGDPREAEKGRPATSALAPDVCVAGGGIAGLTTAYLLARAGKSVAVLEAQPHTGAGETRFTTAHLASILDDRFAELERVRGIDACRLMHQSHAAAIDLIERITRDEAIDCDFRRVDGYLFSAPKSTVSLDEELAAARRAGVVAERVEKLPLTHFESGPALRFPNQATFHPGKYLAGLRRAVDRLGVQMATDARVTDVTGGEHPSVKTEDGATVTAKAVVLATNTPFTGIAVHSKQAAYTTYAIGLPVPRGSVPDALYWDTADPYHYVRIVRSGSWEGDAGMDLLVVGGGDHKTGQADDPARRWSDLAGWAGERFRGVGSPRFHWSGQVFETPDGLAFIGRDPARTGNVYIVTGDSGMGMTHGSLAGILLTDLITGRESPWADLYSPSRGWVRGLGDVVREDANMAAQFADWVTPGDVGGVDEVGRGQGAVVRRGLMKLAVYRDDDGSVQVHSAVCTHMGCIVHWNAAEGTFDCPCHGSRFSKDGAVSHGPAVKDLADSKET